YFTPPPLENVDQSTIAKFTGTTNESAITLDPPVKAERAHYFDAGVTQKIGDGLQLGIDGFYKHARNVLDEGQFGQALILSSFNYREGEIYELRDGSGIGVGAPQFGQRRGFYGTVAYDF